MLGEVKGEGESKAAEVSARRTLEGRRRGRVYGTGCSHERYRDGGLDLVRAGVEEEGPGVGRRVRSGWEGGG